MKNLKYPIAILICTLYAKVFAQLGLKSNLIPNVKPIKGDYLYMAQTEVTNLQYHEFLHWLNKYGEHEQAIQNLPDTAVWRNPLAYNDPFVDYYFRHVAYSDYPVVGVSQIQANAYCDWLRRRLLEKFKTEKKNPISDIIVRLPTTEEWRYAARGGLGKNVVYPWEGESIRITEGKKSNLGKIRLNVMEGKGDFGGVAGDGLNDAGFITTPAFSYWPNGYGLYNMAGNVAEWTSTKGQALGGAWNTSAYFARINSDGFNGNSPEPKSTIGFRYIVEVVKIKSEIPTKKKLNAKKIEREFSKIDSTLFAAKYELSNEWFNTFLTETGKKEYAPKDELWLNHSPYHYRKMYSTFEGTANFPAVNVSYEAAKAYCQWLTNKYHSLGKRKYQKVIFRLPTAAEWHKAAKGKMLNPAYPWGGPYMRNFKGAFLANFFPIPESSVYYDHRSKKTVIIPFDTSQARLEDGLEFAGPVDTYFPNRFGLYNCSGNAAEMIDEEGRSYGGSWNSNADKLLLHHGPIYDSDSQTTPRSTHEEYSGPSPTLGFRVFMEILDE